MDILGPKISGARTSQTKSTDSVDKGKKSDGKGKSVVTTQRDKVSIALDLGEHLKVAGDVRSEKVAHISQQIKDGEYKVDAKEVANKLVEDALGFMGLGRM